MLANAGTALIANSNGLNMMKLFSTRDKHRSAVMDLLRMGQVGMDFVSLIVSS